MFLTRINTEKKYSNKRENSKVCHILICISIVKSANIMWNETMSNIWDFQINYLLPARDFWCGTWRGYTSIKIVTKDPISFRFNYHIREIIHSYQHFYHHICRYYVPEESLEYLIVIQKKSALERIFDAVCDVATLLSKLWEKNRWLVSDLTTISRKLDSHQHFCHHICQ